MTAGVFGRTVNARQIGLARIGLGFAALLEAPEAYDMLRTLQARAEIVRAAEPWWPQLPPGAANLYVLLWVVCAAAFSAGFFARPAGAVLAALMGYHIGRDQNLFSNHTYLLGLFIFLLLFADPARALSIDALMGRTARAVAYWPAWLIKVQMSIVYVSASLGKMVHHSFLSGEVLLRDFRLGPLTHFPAAAPVLAWAVVACQLILAVGLWIPRLRGAALAAGFALHLAIWLTTPPSIFILPMFTFAIVVWTAYLLHVPAERESMGLPRGLDRLRRWDWMGVFRLEADPGPATPTALRRALSVLPIGYLWSAAVPDWLLRWASLRTLSPPASPKRPGRGVPD